MIFRSSFQFYDMHRYDITSRMDSWTWVRVRDLGRGPVLLIDLLTVLGRIVRWATITTCLPLKIVLMLIVERNDVC
jgi:hypothetical protein